LETRTEKAGMARVRLPPAPPVHAPSCIPHDADAVETLCPSGHCEWSSTTMPVMRSQQQSRRAKSVMDSTTESAASPRRTSVGLLAPVDDEKNDTVVVAPSLASPAARL
jgi:hypothetical protein